MATAQVELKIRHLEFGIYVVVDRNNLPLFTSDNLDRAVEWRSEYQNKEKNNAN